MKWRLVRTGHKPGAWNMAVDEAVMVQVARGASPPTFRLFEWDPPSLSLGRVQSFQRDVDAEACRKLGVDVVRRPTGGRAVLHDVEVTYSLIMSQNDPVLPAGLGESFSLATQGIIKGLRLLGVKAEIRGRDEGDASGRAAAADGAGAAGAVRTGACFDSPSWYEVVSGGRKLVGSAQARLMGVFLQHGSILIELDAEKLCRLLRFDSEDERAAAVSHLWSHATSISEILKRRVSFQEVEEAVIAGMRSHISPIELVEGELSPEEIALANTLISRKYGSPSWTVHRKAEV
ncbi:MAG: biotin/lipoate A/B protein ligase family protein [Betaproteobacteria bacterium]